MIICDITHQTEIAGSAAIEVRREGKEPVSIHLDLSPEALAALEAGDWVTLGKLAAKAAPLRKARHPNASNASMKPEQKSSGNAASAQAAKNKPGAPATKPATKPSAEVDEARATAATKQEDKQKVGPSDNGALRRQERTVDLGVALDEQHAADEPSGSDIAPEVRRILSENFGLSPSQAKPERKGASGSAGTAAGVRKVLVRPIGDFPEDSPHETGEDDDYEDPF